MPEQRKGFYIAPFAIDGEPEGIRFWAEDQLSGKWISICESHLEMHGTAFNAPWGDSLSHIQMRFSSASGVALITFSVSGSPAASIALASGLAPVAEADVIRMFVESLRNVHLVKQVALSTPFHKVLAIKERPVMIVVPWPDSSISQQDHAIVQELSIHTAAAFFGRLSPNR